MGETVNIKSMADILSAELFDCFKWEKCNATDYRWECVEENHGKKRTQHPSDVVFRYDDPYRGVKVHINTDLKSYAKSTVDTFDLEETLINLAQSVECAHKSEGFAEAYGVDEQIFVVDGLLFVYNHDGDYDKDFQQRLEKINKKSLSLKRNHRLFVMGPERIGYLYSISRDIDTRVAKFVKAGGYGTYEFYSPDLKVSRVHGLKYGVAPIEFIFAPWLFVVFYSDQRAKLKIVVYSDGKGSSQDEFKYLLDAILSFNLLDDGTLIEIAMQTSDSKAPVRFESARSTYAEENHGRTSDSLEAFRGRLNRISYINVSSVKPPFTENEIAIRK